MKRLMPLCCAWSCEGEALSPLSATKLSPWSHVSPLHGCSRPACMYAHMCNQLRNCNRTEKFAKTSAKRKPFVINNPCSQESRPFSTHSVLWSPRVTIGMVPFQQLVSNKIYYLLAWNLDSSQVHSVVGIVQLCELKRRWRHNCELGAWATYSHRCFELTHFFVLTF
jgi:hypothetical protein